MPLIPTGHYARDFQQEASERGRAESSPDPSRALVVGRSSITCVVVAKIAERAGLKAITEQPAAAAGRLGDLMPRLVIIDGGVDNRDCHELVPALTGMRRATGGSLPATILLSNAHAGPDANPFGGVIDAIVAKPITPEILQPVIERLVGASRP